jgi:hypothetical protein
MGTYFVTSRTWQSRPLFVTDSNRRSRYGTAEAVP